MTPDFRASTRVLDDLMCRTLVQLLIHLVTLHRHILAYGEGEKMKEMISRVFSRGGSPAAGEAANSTVSSELTSRDIENYYLRIIADALQRMLLPLDSFDVAVRRSGRRSGGLPAFAAYVRILRWDPMATQVLLQNLPVLDGRIRKMVKASLILEGSQFAGLWVQASSSVEGCPTSLLGVPCELVHRPRHPAAG
jgi:hypothetical protein